MYILDALQLLFYCFLGSLGLAGVIYVSWLLLVPLLLKNLLE